MKRFYEFVSQRDGSVSDPTVDKLDQEDLLQRIVRMHGSRFRSLLKDMLREGRIEDDPELKKDIQDLCKSIGQGTPDEYPPTSSREREPDIVSRPSADGAGGDIGEE